MARRGVVAIGHCADSHQRSAEESRATPCTSGAVPCRQYMSRASSVAASPDHGSQRSISKRRRSGLSPDGGNFSLELACFCRQRFTFSAKHKWLAVATALTLGCSRERKVATQSCKVFTSFHCRGYDSNRGSSYPEWTGRTSGFNNIKYPYAHIKPKNMTSLTILPSSAV